MATIAIIMLGWLLIIKRDSDHPILNLALFDLDIEYIYKNVIIM